MVQTDIMSAIRQIAAERKIEVDDILEAIKSAIKYSFSDENQYDKDILDVEIDPEAGHIAVFANKTIVDEIFDPQAEILLEEAQQIDKKAKLGGVVKIDITPSGDFGRIAAQAARQVMVQKLREAEREAVIRQFKDRVGEIITVVVQRVTPEGDVICELNKARALMPKSERVMTEFYRLGSSIKVLLKDITEDEKNGKMILVSRADPEFLRELFAMEVPEIESGTVEIVSIAREAGSRSKVAVRSVSEGIDPIGACVGQKGVRINAITNELKSGPIEEKIDIILWDEDVERFLMNAIRPAESISVDIKDSDEKYAVIVVPESQYSLAIGREGQNARLANKLTGWRIDIESDTGFEKNGGSPVSSEGKKDEEVDLTDSEENEE